MVLILLCFPACYLVLVGFDLLSFPFAIFWCLIGGWFCLLVARLKFGVVVLMFVPLLRCLLVVICGFALWVCLLIVGSLIVLIWVL